MHPEAVRLLRAMVLLGAVERDVLHKVRLVARGVHGVRSGHWIQNWYGWEGASRGSASAAVHGAAGCSQAWCAAQGEVCCMRVYCVHHVIGVGTGRASVAEHLLLAVVLLDTVEHVVLHKVGIVCLKLRYINHFKTLLLLVSQQSHGPNLSLALSYSFVLVAKFIPTQSFPTCRWSASRGGFRIRTANTFPMHSFPTCRWCASWGGCSSTAATGSQGT